MNLTASPATWQAAIGERVRVLPDAVSAFCGHEGTVETVGRYGQFWVRFDSGETDDFAASLLEPVPADQADLERIRSTHARRRRATLTASALRFEARS